MCIICVDLQKQLITVNEARGILSEMAAGMDVEHLVEINEMLEKADEES